MLNLAVYKKLLLPRFLSRNAHRPPRKPPRNQRCVDKKLRGRRCVKKQMEAQDVPIAPDMKRLMERIRLARLLVAEIGDERKVL
jgi:hypothetical protein